MTIYQAIEVNSEQTELIQTDGNTSVNLTVLGNVISRQDNEQILKNVAEQKIGILVDELKEMLKAGGVTVEQHSLQ